MRPSTSPNLSDTPLAVEALSVTLHRRQGAEAVLRDVSFIVDRGEAVAVLGEAGSGLAELLLAIVGLLPESDQPRQTGTVRLAAGSFGLVFRDHPLALDPSVRVGRQLARRIRRRRDIPGLLASVGLDPATTDLLAFPHRLRPEQRQHWALAMALARGPDLLLLEEPGAGLDSVARDGVWRDIAALHARTGIAVLLLTADPAAAEALTTRTLVLHAGRIVESGATADVLHRPAHPYTEAFLAARCRPDTDPGQHLLPVAVGRSAFGIALSTATQGCAFRGPCPAGSSRCAQLPPMAPAVLHAGQVACWNATSPARRLPPLPRWPALVPSSATPVLRLDEVSFQYKTNRRPVLANITLRLGDRDAVAVMGGLGSGKSTLLRIAAGLLRPTEGRRAYPGEGLPQMIFADPLASLPPWRSVGGIVGERLRGRGLSGVERATRIEEALVLAQLPPELVTARPADLTVAEAQRVAIARALVIPPALLICDDPLAQLDGRAAAGILNLLAGLRRSQRLALLFASDDIAAAHYLADRILVLEDGHFVEPAPPSPTRAGAP